MAVAPRAAHPAAPLAQGLGLLLLGVFLSRAAAVPLDPSQVPAVQDLFALAQWDASGVPSAACADLPELVPEVAPFSIQCDYKGFVISLNMSHQKLSGRLPSSLGALSLLQRLDLQGNTLEGPIPGPALAPMGGLQHLNLAGNQLTSSIPDELSSLTSLTFLFLGYNMLSGSLSSSLGALTNLATLILRRNSFLNGNIPGAWSTMTALTALDLGYNQLSGPIPDSFSALSNLRVLSLGTNRLTGQIPTWLGPTYASIKLLDLGVNKLSGVIPETLGSASSLVAITLDGNSLQGSLPDSFSSLPNLGFLYAVGNNLVGGIPESYSSLASLRAMDLSNNPSLGAGAGAAFPTLLTVLPKLQSIRLSGCGFQGQLPPALGSVTGLQELYVTNNKLYGAIPSTFCSLQSLQFLDVGGNSLSGSIPTCLGQLPAIQLLAFQNNVFIGPAPQPAKTSTILRYDGNCLDSPAISQRSAASPACVQAADAAISGTPFTAPATGTPPASPGSAQAPPHPAAQGQPNSPGDEQFPQYLFSPPLGSGADSSQIQPLQPSTQASSTAASQQTPGSSPASWLSWLRIILVSLLGVVLLLLTCAVLVLILGPNRSYSGWRGLPGGAAVGAHLDQGPVTEYGLSRIRKATKNFTTVFGKGSFGNVYLAEDFLREQAEPRAVVKRAADPFSLGEFEFRSKVEELARARHPCCVNLLGYCTGKGERILVFEYMPNGTLFDRLHRSEIDPLPWEARVRIAVNVACALEFLHAATPPMVHQAVTSSNILLTADMSAKLSDYGLARGVGSGTEMTPKRRRPTRITRGHSTAVDPAGGAQGDVEGGSWQQSDQQQQQQQQRQERERQRQQQQQQQEQQRQQQLQQLGQQNTHAEKVDVYGFGVVLLELITGQKPMKDVHITSLAAPFLEDPQMMPLMVDAALGGYFNQAELVELGSIARDCVKEDPAQRPSMREVVAHMEAQLSIDIHLYHAMGDASELEQAIPSRAGPFTLGTGYNSLIDSPAVQGKGLTGTAISVVSSAASSVRSLLGGMQTSSAPQTPTGSHRHGDVGTASEAGDSDRTNSSTLLFITPKNGAR